MYDQFVCFHGYIECVYHVTLPITCINLCKFTIIVTTVFLRCMLETS